MASRFEPSKFSSNIAIGSIRHQENTYGYNTASRFESFKFSPNVAVGSQWHEINLLTASKAFRESEFSFENVSPYLAECAVEDIIKNIPTELRGFHDRSSSECPSEWRSDALNDGMDRRLKSWMETLYARKQLQKRIQLSTGKRAEDVLFNRPSTIDVGNKQMMLRLLDHAQHSNADTKAAKAADSLKPHCHPQLCTPMHAVLETLPSPNQLEFMGLPTLAKLELAAISNEAPSNWLLSERLAHRLQKHDVKRVLEFFPDIDNLQVTPTHVHHSKVDAIKCIGEDKLFSISDDTSIRPMSPEIEEMEELEEPSVPFEIAYTPSYGVKINGRTFRIDEKTSKLMAEQELFFQCDPYQRTLKTLVELENIGERPLFISCKYLPYYKEHASVNSVDDEFVFDSTKCVLHPQQIRRFDVMFQPKRVGLFKAKWRMCIEQAMFCRGCSFIVHVHGLCTPPVAFREQVDVNLRNIYDKSNWMELERIPQLQGSIVPLIESPFLLCPYERIFDERELFNAQNPGHICTRYDDLEMLKQLHSALKKPREPAWDFRIETLREFILRREGVEQRQVFNDFLLTLLQPMKCGEYDMFKRLDSNPEQQRTRFIYVRGVVGSAIEEWEKLAIELESQFFRTELKLYLAELTALEEESGTEGLDAEAISALISKRLKSSKYFRDSLYVQSYTLLCDAAENIVSVIESTVHI